MDIVRFKGGLGNQMFQYALVEALRSRGREVGCSLGFYRRYPDLAPFVLDQVFPKLDLNEIEDGIFQEIDDRWRKIKSNAKTLEVFKRDIRNRFFYVEEADGKFDGRVFKTSNCAFVGFWQTERYFSGIKAKLKEKYSFCIDDDKLQKFADKLQGSYFSIHVRGGDYLREDCQMRYGEICTEKYYKAAVGYIKEKVPEAKFIVFSDEVEKVDMECLQDNTLFNKREFENYQDWYDMYLMSKCRGNIIANSTFSWWGAWLNTNPDKVVVSPKTWLNGRETPDIWCDGWVRL